MGIHHGNGEARDARGEGSHVEPAVRVEGGNVWMDVLPIPRVFPRSSRWSGRVAAVLHFVVQRVRPACAVWLWIQHVFAAAAEHQHLR